MASNKKVVGELVYEIKGDDTEYSKVINRADQSTENLGKTMGRSKGALDGMITSLAGAYLGYQGVTKAIEATIGSAISYESAFAGVRKTVDGTEEQLQALSDRFIELSKSMPVTAEEFAKIGELAGQLGVPISQIDSFAETIAKIGTSTNLTTEQAATDFARFANIMQMPLENVDRLGATIVELGNNMATTESEIDAMALRIAGAGATLGLTEAQVLGWAGALSSVGIEAEAGGSSISRLMIDISALSSKGGKDLNNFAKVAGMSAEDFKKKYQTDANGALLDFFKGLQKIKEGGGDVIGVLNTLGITEVRQRDAVLRLTGAGDKLTESLDLANKGWKENTALNTEAEKRYKTTASQLTILKNNWADLGRQLGFVILPVVNLVIQFFGNMARTVVLAVDAIKTAVLGMGTGVLLGFQRVIKMVENFVNSAIDLANGITNIFGIEKHFDKVNFSMDALTKGIETMKQKTAESANETVKSFFLVGEGASGASDSTKKLADTQTLLRKGIGETSDEIKNLVGGLEDSGKASKDAEQKAKELADRWTKLKDETVDLKDKGTEALRDLANDNVKSLEKIEDKIKELKKELADLKTEFNKDMTSEDKGIAERIVEEKLAIEELKKKLAEEKGKATDESKKDAQTLIDMQEKLNVLKLKQSEQDSKTNQSTRDNLKNEIADLERKISEEKGKDSSSATIANLEAEIKKREDALSATKDLQVTLAPQITEATRRAGLTDLQREIEDYNARKAQRQIEYEEKKSDLEAKLALEEQNKTDTVALYQLKQDQITAIIEAGNQRFKDLADNRVKITEEEVTKQICYYNQLAQAIANSKSATRTSEVPKFSVGGYVPSGGEVHAGEYVIPANMVAKYGGLIKALEGIRTGQTQSTVNNNITLNNAINEQIDMDAVLKNMSFELNK